MNIGRIKLNNTWRDMTEVADGGEFLIQNIPSQIPGNVEYIVSASAPGEDKEGGVLPELKQLKFKKVGGNLYMRNRSGYTEKEVNIEKIEE